MLFFIQINSITTKCEASKQNLAMHIYLKIRLYIGLLMQQLSVLFLVSQFTKQYEKRSLLLLLLLLQKLAEFLQHYFLLLLIQIIHSFLGFKLQFSLILSIHCHFFHVDIVLFQFSMSGFFNHWLIFKCSILPKKCFYRTSPHFSRLKCICFICIFLTIQSNTKQYKHTKNPKL